VGKSTLFNALTGTRDALVADVPGLTRDRLYGRARAGGRPLILVDTGGLTDAPDGLDPLVARQARQAIDEADVILFLTDARAGPTPADETLATGLRATGKPVVLAANKGEGLQRELVAGELYALGLGEPAVISAAHRQGLGGLLERVAAHLPPAPEAGAAPEAPGTRIAVVGRPNVGKSTLVNRMVGAERVLAWDEPGTTRDSVPVPFARDGRPYVLVDTAGVRRRGRVSETVEKFSVIKALQAIEAADVAILLVDAREGVTDQDLHLLGHVVEAGRAVVVAANKWDGLPGDRRERVRGELARRLAFVDYARVHRISALHGTGVGELFRSVDEAAAAASASLPTPALTRCLREAVAAHPPPLVRGRRIKLRYAHQGGSGPPVIVVHGTQAESLPDGYRRYLVRAFREAFELRGTPLRVELKSGENPYAGRRNMLTERQRRRRKRLLRHAKGR
jgi:GTP-binding protein